MLVIRKKISKAIYLSFSHHICVIFAATYSKFFKFFENAIKFFPQIWKFSKKICENTWYLSSYKAII